MIADGRDTFERVVDNGVFHPLCIYSFGERPATILDPKQSGG